MTLSGELLRTSADIDATISCMRNVLMRRAAARAVSSADETLVVTSSPLSLAAWWAAVIVLTAAALSGIPAALSVPVVLVAATAAAVLAVLMTRHVPHRDRTRLVAYLCAVLATQAAGVFFGVIALLPGVTMEPGIPAPTAIAFAVADAGLSLWTFVLIRFWLSHGHKPSTGRINYSRTDRLLVGCAAAGAALGGFFVANVVYGQLTTLLLVPAQSFPLAPGGVEQWLIVTVVLALAGVIEEPVFVGVAVVSWPRLDRRNFLIAFAVSILARVSIHLYYAGGTAQATVTAIGLVILWCAMWSGFNLFLVYRTRRLWPVMLAHGLQNAFAAAAGPWTITDTPRHHLAVIAMMLLLFGMLSFIAIGGLMFLLTRVHRRWHARLTEVQVAPT
jgi:membrane protease YdiL (CAAX protease family)